MKKQIYILFLFLSAIMTYSQYKGVEEEFSKKSSVVVSDQKAFLLAGDGSLQIGSTGSLKIFAGASLKVKDAITNLGNRDQIIVQSGANLLQINDDAVNVGALTSESEFKIGTARTQYNYVGSPVAFEAGQTFKTIFPNSPDTAVLYHNQTTNTFVTSSGANIPGRGSAVKEPAGTTVLTLGKTTAKFKGTPQNGIITLPIANKDINGTLYGYNLVGNPYASNIDLTKLYNANGGDIGSVGLPVESPNISSTFYFWDNNNNIITQQQGSGYNGQSYAIFNVISGTGNEAGSLGGSVSGTKKPTNIVKVGQGFMTKSKKSTYNFIFNNSVRTDVAAEVNFLGKGLSESTRDRYWMKMTAPSGMTSTLAVVHFVGGSDLFGEEDSRTTGGSDAIFTLINTEKIAINGRSAFRDTDKIPLGSAHFTGGNYTIAIETAEGIFKNGQSVYLKDRSNGIITDLTQGEYHFTEQNGETAGRFEIIYKPESVLATDTAVKEEILIYRTGNDFVAETHSKNITRLDVFDTSGRQILSLQPNAKKVIINGNHLTTGVYILKIDQSGIITGKKIIK